MVETAVATDDESVALGVEESLSGCRWEWRPGALDPATSRLGAAIGQRFSIPEIVGRLMAVRGIAPADVEAYLTPTLRALMPDPSCLRDMDAAAARLAAAVCAGETVAIFGDYDVDGACSAALLASLLRELGCAVHTHIPDRMTEGYGPNEIALLALADRGATLVVCVDCGTAAGDILACLEGRAEVVVVDHHKSEGRLPAILATVNPNRPDCDSGLTHLCAAALTFLTAVAVVRDLRRRGWFGPDRPEPDLRRQLDVVALATVCDVMPLRGLNRAFVRQGLRIMERRERTGLRHLMEVAGVKATPTAFSCGFSIGPRINAGGRIAEADLGLNLLLTQDATDAQRMAERLDAVNRRRQDVESEILDRAMMQAQEQFDAGQPVLFLTGADWHPGVVGIVASRVKERFNRPVLVGAEQADGSVKGSGRSVPGLDLGTVVIAARELGLLTTGGGHAMAAGFSLPTERVREFHAFLSTRLHAANDLPERAVLEIDAVLSPREINVEMARHLESLAPFGPGNEEPLVAMSPVQVVRADRIGSNGATLRLMVAGEGNRSIKALMFRIEDGPLLSAFEDRTRPHLTLAGWLRREEWQGRESATFFIRDAAYA